MSIEIITNNQLENNCIYYNKHDDFENLNIKCKNKDNTILNQEQILIKDETNLVYKNSITKKSIYLLSLIDEFNFIFGYCSVLFNFTNNIKIFISRFFNKLLLNLYFFFPKTKKTKSDLDTNINIKLEGITINNCFEKLNTSSDIDEIEPLIKKDHKEYYNHLEQIKVVKETQNQNKNINISINLNFNFGFKKKKSYNNLRTKCENECANDMIGEFGKIKSDYKSFNHYINSKEQIYLTHDKSWGWFIDIESQKILIKKN